MDNFATGGTFAGKTNQPTGITDMTFIRLLPSMIVASLLAAGPTFAQTAPAPAATAGAPATGTAEPAAKTRATKRDALIEKRITDLHRQLKITSSEEKPFNDFADVMRANAAEMNGLVAQRIQAAKSGTAVDQMKSYAGMAQAHSQQMERLVSAFSTLYDALSPDQKKAADESFRDYARHDRAVQS